MQEIGTLLTLITGVSVVHSVELDQNGVPHKKTCALGVGYFA